MNEPARLLLAATVLISAASTSWGQVYIQPTPAPPVTAENEAWYHGGEPLAFAGSLYYPGGAAIHFLPNEMVRSGFYRGVPLYSRTTIEPFSIIFVPVGGGLMQPYERRRDLDMAGTQGSSAPSISPVLAPSVSATTSLGAPWPPMAQAAAPPVVGSQGIVDEATPPLTSVAHEETGTPPPQPTGTAGGTITPVPQRPLPIRRDAANAMYFRFDNARWFSAGPPVSLDVRSMTQVGESQGFPVYARHPGDRIIYVPIARDVETYGRYRRGK